MVQLKKNNNVNGTQGPSKASVTLSVIMFKRKLIIKNLCHTSVGFHLDFG